MPRTVKRQPPQPTDTKAARCAAGVVEISTFLFSLLPGATIRQRRKMEQQISLQRDEINRRGVTIFQLQSDIRELEKVKSGSGPAFEDRTGTVDEFSRGEILCKISLVCQPAHLQFIPTPEEAFVTRDELSPHILTDLQSVAQKIATYHAETHPEKTIKITVARKVRVRA